MTDPGLTDLIAAHTLRVVELNEAVRYPECNGCDWVGGLVKDHAVHLASVVEQHTNGQITEVDVRARARVKAANKRASIRITQIRKEEAARFEAEARAAKAEATIARVKKLQGDLFQQGGNLIAQWGVARLIRAALQEEFIRAALEGEQQ